MIVQATYTNDYISYLLKFAAGLQGDPATSTVVGTQWDPRIKVFKVGEGGWIDTLGGRQARPPDPDLRRATAPFIQDLDAVVDSTRDVANQRYPALGRTSFTKNLVSGDFSVVSPNVIQVTCRLDMGDFNVSDSGGSPEIWELALFCAHPTVAGQRLMVAYCTFSGQVKTSAAPIENIVQLTVSNT
jgi:hypothetical protein